ncbi:MAG: VanZ family protein [Sulfurisoma sp.]|nr:VanZ family protein [Sulfurisoma sp.]
MLPKPAGWRTPSESRLPLYLAGAYTLLAIYGSLYPFSGWRDSGVPLAEFLTAAWPRYFTAFDLAANFAAYLPLGFLWVPALRPLLGPTLAVAIATVVGSSFSLSVETLQNFLPSRVPSNADLACNALGTLAGALAGARWGAALLDGGRIDALRRQHFMHGRAGDWGLLLIALWLLAQLNPLTLLFGNGDLRGLLGLPTPLPYTASRFAEIEAATVCAHTVAIGLLAGRIARGARHAVALGLIAAGLIVKTLALTLLLQGAQGLAWATPGSLSGLAVGVLILLAVSPAPTFPRQALAALALLFATVLVNLAPDNPYLINTQQVWVAGQFLNFNGATRLASSLWPFLVLPWLFLLRLRHE